MTSRISFLKLMQEDFKRRSWMAALLAVVFFLAYPVAMMISLDNMMNTGIGVVYSVEELQRWVTDFLGAGSYVHFALIIATAAILAAGEFSYLHSREKLDLYHSIPVRRKKLFFSGYLTGALMFLAVFAVCQILCALIVLAKGLLTATVVYEMIKGVFLRIVDFIFLYHMCIFAMLFTGNTVLAAFGMIVLAVYGPMLSVIVNSYLNIGFYTMVDPVNLYTSYTTPVGILMCLENGISQGTPYLIPTLLTVAGIAVFFAADIWMCEHRKTEHAGLALAFPKVEQILKFLLVLPASLLAGLAAYGLTGTEKRYWMFGGFLFGVVVFSAFMEFVYHKDIKMVLRHRLGLGITAVTGLLLIGCVSYDWIGFNSWLPDQEQIEAMAVCSSGNFGSSVYQVRMKESYDNGSYENEYRNNLERMRDTETEDFGSIYELVREGIQSEDKYQDNCTMIYVKYVLTNGKEVYRCYWVTVESYEKVEDMLYQEDWYREMCYPILADTEEYEAENLQRIEVGSWNSDTIVLEGEQAREVYECYRTELGEMSVNTLRGEENVLQQESEAETEESIWNDVTDFYMIFYNKDGMFRQESGYPFGKEFVKTGKLLKKYGLKN